MFRFGDHGSCPIAEFKFVSSISKIGNSAEITEHIPAKISVYSVTVDCQGI